MGRRLWGAGVPTITRTRGAIEGRGLDSRNQSQAVSVIGLEKHEADLAACLSARFLVCLVLVVKLSLRSTHFFAGARASGSTSSTRTPACSTR